MDQIGVENPPVSEVKVIKRVIIQKPLTLQQEIVVGEVGKGRKTKAEILRIAKYAPSVVDHPERVFGSPAVQAAVAPILDRLQRHRDRVLARMEKLVGKAGYTSLSITLSHMNKDIELLAGRPTDRTEYTLPDEEKERLDRLLKMNR